MRYLLFWKKVRFVSKLKKHMLVNSEETDVRHLPAPATRVGVGFAKFRLLDAHRKNVIDKKSVSHLEVLVWYPAEKTVDFPCKPYLAGHRLKRLFLLNLRFGYRYVKNSLRRTKTNSHEGAPVSQSRERYPVLIFSHDIGMLPEYYTALMEHLASEGYFVFAPNHPFVSEANADEANEKRIIRFNPVTGLRWAVTMFKSRRKLQGKSYEQKWAVSKALYPQWETFDPLYSGMKRDRSFLLDFLQALNSTLYYHEYPYNLFTRRLNLTQVGVIGHGWGGSSSVDALIQDDRIKAAINLDGLQISRAANHVISKPLFVIYAEQNSGINEGIYFNASEREEHTIENSKHASFCDFPFLAKSKTRDTHVLHQTVNLAVHFFDRHLKKIDHTAFVHARHRY